jgi:hypothetical protein
MKLLTFIFELKVNKWGLINLKIINNENKNVNTKRNI